MHRKKKKALNRRYNTLIRQAWENEYILHKFQNLELRLMQCESLTELIHVLLVECKEKFELEAVTLSLFDPEFKIQQLLQLTEQTRNKNFPGLTFDFDALGVYELFAAGASSRLGPYDPALHANLFRHSYHEIKSIALLLLKRDSRIIGSLNLGDSRSDRFRSNTATDFLQHLGAVISVCIDMTVMREQLRNLGFHDALTGVNNRRYFDQCLSEEIALSQRYKRKLCCLFIDVDHFKKINDNYGHTTGDHVLKQIAGIIRETLRTTDILCRYGGEEFAALLIETDIVNACEVADRIFRNIQHHSTELDGQSIRFTVSIGVSGSPDPINTDQAIETIGSSLIAAADSALYKAKQSGRNCVVCIELP